MGSIIKNIYRMRFQCNFIGKQALLPARIGSGVKSTQEILEISDSWVSCESGAHPLHSIGNQ